MAQRYGIVLLLTLVSLVFQLATSDQDWVRFITILLQGATLLLALWAAEVRPLLRRLATLLVAAAAIGSAIAFFGVGDLGTSSARITTMLLVVLAPAAIAWGLVRQLREQGTVTVQTMFGGLCIYLLIGIFFAFAYATIGEFSEQPFFAGRQAETPSHFLYFSFVTLTTTGYGDFTAGLDVGRSLAITEALIGQIYLVTVVAVIVSNLAGGRLGTRRRSRVSQVTR